MAYKKPKTEFGVELAGFCARTGMTMKEVAAAADVIYTSMVDNATGRSPGHELVPKVRDWMRQALVEAAEKRVEEATRELQEVM